MTHVPVRLKRSLEYINIIIGEKTSSVKSLIYNDGFSVNLGKEISFKIFMSDVEVFGT
jgi:hypothetical protein